MISVFLLFKQSYVFFLSFFLSLSIYFSSCFPYILLSVFWLSISLPQPLPPSLSLSLLLLLSPPVSLTLLNLVCFPFLINTNFLSFFLSFFLFIMFFHHVFSYILLSFSWLSLLLPLPFSLPPLSISLFPPSLSHPSISLKSHLFPVPD